MKTRDQVEAALTRLTERLSDPRALEIGAEERVAATEALTRARQQLVEELPPVLVVAIAGGTGVGKSTLINALAGAEIAEASAERPTTTHIRVYHHQDVPLGGLPTELGYGARFVAHDREELRWKVLVDTPDLDSFVRDHRDRTRRLLKSAGLVLYVFSPEKYLEERLWSVLREERAFSATAAVLNKVDALEPDELEKVREDLRERLAGAGLGRVRVFQTCAVAHAEGGVLQRERSSLVDETGVLRAFLERELRAGDATRIARESRRRVLENLARAVEAAGPADLAPELDALESESTARIESTGARLVEVIAPELEAIEAELSPLATLRQHERFHGPFRAWLSVADFLTIGLAGLVDRIAGRPARGAADVVQRILGQARVREVDALLRGEERAIQDRLFERGLPVARWRAIAGEARGERVLLDLAREVEERFETRASVRSGRGRGIVWTVSKIGGLVPAAMVIGGLYLLLRDLFTGEYLGLGLLGHLAALVVLFFLALHGIVAVLLPASGRLGRGVGLAAAREVLPVTIGEWFAAYRTDLEADLEDLAEPLETLRAELDEEAVAAAPTSEPDGPSAVAWPEPEEAPEGPAPGPAPGAGRESEAETEPAVDPEERLLRALERESTGT